MSALEKNDAQSTRDRILSSAFALFAENGFEGTTTRHIAEHAKVNEVTIFRSFGSKEVLFQEVVRERLPLRNIQTVVDLNLTGPLEEVMVRNAMMVLDILKQNRHFIMMLVGELWRHTEFKAKIGPEIYGQAIDFLTAQLRMLVDRGRLRPVDPAIAEKVWIGMVQSYYLFNYLVGPGKVDPEVEESTLRGMADIFVKGVGKVG